MATSTPESPAAAHAGWETPIYRIGREGLQLNKSLDELSPQEVSRLSNLYHSGGDLTSRLGQTLLYNLGGSVHSIRRLNVPSPLGATWFWGAGANWFRGGLSLGVPSVLQSGFSGNPITMLPVRPALSGESWMVAADSSKMAKATQTSPALPLGLPAPTTPTTAVQPALQLLMIAGNSGDGTDAAHWVAFGGYPPNTVDTSGGGAALAGIGTIPPSGSFSYSLALTKLDVPGISGSAVQFGGVSSANGSANKGASQGLIAGLSLPFFTPRNYSAFTGGTAITDDDAFHLNLEINAPTNVSEVRIYFVVSPFVMPTAINTGTQAWSLPGMGVGTFSASAFMLVLRPSDYTNALIAAETIQDAADRVRTAAFLEKFADPVAAALADTPSTETALGAGVWSTFSEIGFPVMRRGDFIKIGAVTNADWAHITGVYLVAQSPAEVDHPAFKVAVENMYFTGGSGPDTGSDIGGVKYDYRVTNFDPRTRARSNPSPIVTGAVGALSGAGLILTADLNVPDLTLDALRQPILISPPAYSDSAILQEAWRRGGSLADNWRFVGINTANGGAITDTFSDVDISNADTVPIDHFQPVATVDTSGNVVLAQPLPILFGPFDDGTVCGLGDPHQPGFLYASIAGEIDHWPSTGAYAVEVCSPAEELMNGCVTASGGFVLSREQGYSVYTNLTGGGGIAVTPAGCKPGLTARWGFCARKFGIFYVARDGVRVTMGGDSTLLSEQIRPLFHNETRNGIAPIDFSVPAAIRLEVYDTDLYFLFQDTSAVRQCYVYSLAYRYWRPYAFARLLACVYADETQSEADAQGAMVLLLGSTNGNAYTHSGFTDDGVGIAFSVRSGAWNFGRPREDKLLGDLVVEADLQGATLSAQTFLNTEAITNLTQTAGGLVGRTRYTFDPFGTTPQHARNLSLQLSGTAPTTAQVAIAFAGVAVSPLPDVTMNRATTWEPLSPTEGYLYACCLDCDTGGTPRTIYVEYDLAGVIATAATLTVTSSGRHKLWFSWPEVHAQLVRLRPSDNCVPWMLFGAEWISQPEPARIAGWDTNFEDLGDSYCTGLDLEVDTFGAVKQINIFADGVLLGSPTVTASGHSHLHLSVTPPRRAHVYRFVATDANPGLLYSHKWIVESEPLEQGNWNAPYTVWNSLSDKYLKGVILEVDTYGVSKSVSIEVDQQILQTITVTATGRSVVNFTWPQVLGRVFRIIPTDNNLSRLYTAQPLFDEEPFALGRWEGQLYDFDFPESGWGSLLSMDCCYKATAPVTLTFAVYDATGRLLQTITGMDLATRLGVLPATGGAKQKRYVVFLANKGVLFKPIATSADGSGVTVYKEESRMRLQPWSGGGVTTKWLGANDDLQPTREMTKAAVAAGRQGGAAR
jgi:hypothetical protein